MSTYPTVSIILNVIDGAGNPVIAGSAVFTPTGAVSGSDGSVRVAPQPVTVGLASASFPVSAGLLPTDLAVIPANWAWQIAFTGVDLEPFTFKAPAGPASFAATSGTPGVITWTATAGLTVLPAGTGVTLAGGSLPTGVTAATTYYVVAPSGQTVHLSATPGGSAIAFTSTGSGTLTVASYPLGALVPLGSSGNFFPYLLAPAVPPVPGQALLATGQGNALEWGDAGDDAPGLPLTTPGDTLYQGSSGAARLPGNTDTTRKFLREAGTGTVANAPAWDTIQSGDLPSAATFQQGAVQLGGGTTNFYRADGTWAAPPGGGGSGAVSSVFGRTGAVVATSGDYTAAQVTGAVRLGGDIGGTAAAPVVAQIQGTSVGAPTGSADQYLDATGAWSTPAGTGASLSNPMTAPGDTIFGGTSGAPQRLAGNVTVTRKFMRATGTGSAATAPAWDTITSADLPAAVSGAQGAVRLAGDLSGTAAAPTVARIQGTAIATPTGSAAAYLNSAGSWTVPPGTGGGGTLGGYVAPAVVTLTFATTVAVNAALGNAFGLTLTGNCTISNPSNAVNGQVIRFRITSGGARTVTWGTAYDFGTATAPALSSTSGKVDIIAWEYVASISKWCYLGSGLGY